MGISVSNDIESCAFILASFIKFFLLVLHNECLQAPKSLVYTSCGYISYMKWVRFSKEEHEVLHVGRTHHLFSARQETTSG